MRVLIPGISGRLGMMMAVLLTQFLTPVLYIVFRKHMPSPEAARFE